MGMVWEGGSQAGYPQQLAVDTQSEGRARQPPTWQFGQFENLVHPCIHGADDVSGRGAAAAALVVNLRQEGQD